VDHELFAWEVLAATVDEDGQMLYEPLVAVRGELPDEPEAERQALVERTLRALVGAGLIELRRADADDPAARLDDDEVDAVLHARGWRTLPPGPEGSATWLRATPAGVQALGQEAPPELRSRRAAGEEESETTD